MVADEHGHDNTMDTDRHNSNTACRREPPQRRARRRERLHSLAEARAQDDGIVVLRGDFGGQIYVVAPARKVRADERVLERLVKDLEAIIWQEQPDDSAAVRFYRHRGDLLVPGGKGGGRVEPDPWIHPQLVELGLEAEIRAVLNGESAAIKDRCYSLRWAVVRVEANDRADLEERVSIVQVLENVEEANAEIERLNSSSNVNATYFVEIALVKT